MPSSSRSALRKAASRLRAGTSTPADEELVQNYRNYRAPILLTACELVGPILYDEDAILTARLKRYESIVRKVIREQADISRMDDIVGLRVIAGSLEAQARLRLRLEATEGYTYTRDYAVHSREDGYRAVHVVLRVARLNTAEQFPIEIQIRTLNQHLWASFSESFGQQVKEGGGSKAVRALLIDVALHLAELDTKGKVVPLTPGATSESELIFYLLHFNLKSGEVLEWMDLDRAIDRAVNYLLTFEMYRQQTTEFETVLMCSRTKDTIRQTHIRYFPEDLINELVHGAGASIPNWALERVLRRQ